MPNYETAEEFFGYVGRTGLAPHPDMVFANDGQFVIAEDYYATLTAEQVEAIEKASELLQAVRKVPA